MSRMLVTGAAGFIGGHVFEALCREGHEVWCLDNNWRNDSNPAKVLSPDGIIRNLKVDILNVPLMIDAFFGKTKFEAVIHLAAQPSLQHSIEDSVHDASVNIIGTLNLLELCKKYDVNRFVFASTSAVYASQEDGIYLENDKIDPLTPYGISKATAERYIQVSGLPYSILRLGNVYGPGQVPLGENQLIPRALAHIYQNKQFVINGDGEQKRDFVYVKDVADAFIPVAERDVGGIFNIASGMSWKVVDVLELIKINAGFNRSFVHGSEQEGELRNVSLPSHFARQKFGWQVQTSLEVGIAETVKAWPK